MDLSPSTAFRASGDPILLAVTNAESARYTHDMLDTLTRIALRHEQTVLARLLEVAAREADRLVRTQDGG
ncbi:MAG: hypothetical protein KGL26_03440 [Pseudomonadota bacterium]|nr:hypothetical protein [Pseudomonadota bacterium]